MRVIGRSAYFGDGYAHLTWHRYIHGPVFKAGVNRLPFCQERLLSPSQETEEPLPLRGVMDGEVPAVFLWVCFGPRLWLKAQSIWSGGRSSSRWVFVGCLGVVSAWIFGQREGWCRTERFIDTVQAAACLGHGARRPSSSTRRPHSVRLVL